MLTPAMLTALATCPRRFEIEHIRNLRLKGRRRPPWPPNIKRMLLECLEARDALAAVGVSWMQAESAAYGMVRIYSERLRGLLGAGESASEIDEMERAAGSILDHYIAVHGDDASMRWEAPRGVVKREIGDTGSFYADRLGPTVHYGQQRLSVVRSFTSERDPARHAAVLEHLLWLHGVAWLAGTDGLLVDVVRTKAPSKPDTVQCRKCKGEGCEECNGTGAGGLSKRPCDTTLELWMEAARRHGLDPGEEAKRCAAVTDRLAQKGETFSYRLVIQPSDKLIRDWESNLAKWVEAAKHYQRHGWPQNPSACRGCPYQLGCNGADDAVFEQVEEGLTGLEVFDE